MNHNSLIYNRINLSQILSSNNLFIHRREVNDYRQILLCSPSLCTFRLYKVQYKNHTVHYSQNKHMLSYVRIFIAIWCMCISDRVSRLDTFDESSSGVWLQKGTILIKLNYIFDIFWRHFLCLSVQNLSPWWCKVVVGGCSKGVLSSTYHIANLF